MPRAASPHGGNLVAAVRSRFKRCNKASSDAGPELAGRDGIAAMESPQALMCPLEKGVRGIKISGLLPLTGFCGFLVLIEMKFRYERMIFRFYAQTKSFSCKGKVSVL